MTQCNGKSVVFKRLGPPDVVADSPGGTMTSDAEAMLLGKVNEQLGLLERFAELFTDYRNPNATGHTVLELVRQGV